MRTYWSLLGIGALESVAHATGAVHWHATQMFSVAGVSAALLAALLAGAGALAARRIPAKEKARSRRPTTPRPTKR